jgi:hypothetical protein
MVKIVAVLVVLYLNVDFEYRGSNSIQVYYDMKNCIKKLDEIELNYFPPETETNIFNLHRTSPTELLIQDEWKDRKHFLCLDSQLVQGL